MLPADAASSDVVDVSMAELRGNKRGDAGPRVDGAPSKRRRLNDGGGRPVTPESVAKDVMQQLPFPYSPDQPTVSETELQRLDALADVFQRLTTS